MRCTEDLNAYLATNWRSFSTQNYFDKNGVFVSVVFSGPMLAASMFLLLNALRSASSSVLSNIALCQRFSVASFPQLLIQYCARRARQCCPTLRSVCDQCCVFP